MLRIVRRGDRHDPKDLTVSLRFEGEFGEAFQGGRAEGLAPGETLKNLVHAAVREHGSAEIEPFGIALCQRILQVHPRVTRARVEVAERPWHRMEAGGKAQGQSFLAGGPEQKTVAITSNGRQLAVVAGIDQLTVMRTSGLRPPRRPGDAGDALDDGVPPILVGALSIRWTYSHGDVAFGPSRQGVRAAVVDTLALHAGRSIHYTLYAIADVILSSFEEITEVTLSMHERPYRPADMFRANENPDDLFIALEEPVGVVEVTVERDAT